MKFAGVVFLMVLSITSAKQCANRRTNSKLICYYSEVTDVNTCMCTHIILPANSDAQTINFVQEKFKSGNVLLTVNEFNEDLVNTLKNSKIDGLEIDLKKLDDKHDVPDFISTVKSKLGPNLLFAVSIPSRAEVLAKYYDLKALTKQADLFILQTAFLGASQNVTFHPSRLSGLWDMQNTDSVVDLVTGMGAPLSKLVITAPVQAFQFTLQDEAYTAPGSPALEIKSLTRERLCNKMSRDFNWTLERDEDQAGPYIFRKNMWIAFDDATSMDIKAKYTRVRGLAGLALKDLTQDGGEKCGGSLLEAAHIGLSKQSRAPRGAVLQSLEREILQTPSRPLDTIQISPYRISRVIDVEGNVHSIRQDTRTEFECARQGYYVHPRSCGRFYRCVKFDQLADDFSVFEFDCPTGLSFDSRYEVCVWPGSLPYSSACSGSSEIAPVPRTRFVCPQAEGYYADPENCRWFFACLDHGKSPMSAYEFRCPFGLVFDESRLVCEWPWLVPKCGSGSALGFEYSSQISLGGIRLDTYDGLGALGVVGLGGLSGPLIQPQAKVYTSVSNGGVGLLQGQGGLHSNVNLGYTQNAVGAGFKQGILGSTQIESSGISSHGSSTFHGKGFGIGLANVEANLGSRGSSLTSGAAHAGHNFNQYSQGVSGGAGYNNQETLQLQNRGFQKNNGVFLQSTHGQAQGIVGAVHGASYQTNIDYGRDAFNLHRDTDSRHQSNIVHLAGGNVVGSEGLKTASVIDHGIALQQPVLSLTSSSAAGDHHSSNFHHQTNVAQSLAAAHGNVNSYGTVISTPVEKIHIVGGFSAVGTGGKSVDVSQNGLNINNIAHVIPAPPASVSTVSILSPSPVPPVAAAPVPVVKSDFEAYEGGVVANVPELQYKIVTPSASNVYFQSNFKDNGDYSFSRGTSGFANTSQNYVNYVSSTPVPVALSTTNYEYNTPIISFTQGSTTKPLVILDQQSVVHHGYNYHKPSTAFEEQSIQSAKPAAATFTFTKHSSADKAFTLNSYVTPKPLDILQPIQPAVISSFSINSGQQSLQAVQPVVSVTPVVPIIEHKITQANSVQPVSVTPTVPVFRQKAQPATIFSYNFQNILKNGGYQYSKPEVSFETIQPVVSLTPTIQQNSHSVQPAVLSSYSFQNAFASKHGYNYPTPNAVFEEKSPHPQQSLPPAVVSSFSINSAQKSLSAIQPVVSVTSVVPIIEHKVAPQAVSSNNTQSAIVSSYDFRDIVKNEGYQYTKPIITFNNQPASVSSYNIQNSFSSKPNVAFERNSFHTPQPVQPAVISSFRFHNAEKPLSVVQPIVSVTPVVPLEEHKVTELQDIQPVVSVTPTIPTVKQQLQPGFVSSYNFHNTAKNEDYQYSKAAVLFNAQPVVRVIPTVPVIPQRIHPIQPAVVSSFSFQNLTGNEGYNYFKQTVPAQTVVNVTPATTIIKDTLQQKPAILSSYNYQNNRGHQNVKQVVPFVSVTEPVPVIQYQAKPTQPDIISGYSFQNEAHNEGYKYTKQTVPLQPLQPVVSVTPTVPIIQVQPAVVSSYSFQNGAHNAGYKYNKQKLPLQPLQSIVSVTPTVPIIQEKVQLQPAVVSSYSFQNLANNGYKYTKQAVPLQPTLSVIPTVPVIEEKIKSVHPAIVSSYNFQGFTNDGYKYSKEAIPVQSIQSVENISPVIPIITHKNVQSVQPSVVSSYSFNNLGKSESYDYSKQIPVHSVQSVSVTPTVPTVKQPVIISSYSFNNLAKNDYSGHVTSEAKFAQPAVVSSFSFQKSAEKDVFNEGYKYHQPSIAFEERPLVPVASVTQVVPDIEKKIQPFTNVVQEQLNPTQPSILFSYSFKNSEAARNEGYNLVNSEIKSIQPIQPVAVSSFRNPVQPQGYSYPKPLVAFEEKPRQPFQVAIAAPTVQPILTVSTPVGSTIKQKIEIAQPAITSHIPQVPLQNEKIFLGSGSFGEKVSLAATQKPIIIEDTIVTKQEISIKPSQSAAKFQGYDHTKSYISSSKDLSVDYENRKPVEEVPFIAKKAYVTGQEQNQAGYNYPKPAISFEERPAQTYSVPTIISTAKYEQVSVPVKSSPHRGRVTFTTPTYVQDNYYTTPRSNIYISTPAPFSRSKGRAQINFNAQYNELYAATPKPTYTSTIATVFAAKPQPLGQLHFYDSRLQSTSVPIITTENLQFGKKYSFGSVADGYNLKVPTSTPHSAFISTSTQNYVDDSFVVTTPKETYLPAKNVNEEYIITSKQSAPAPLRTNTASKAKTYIRVNDFHPLLPAKLGAQCTCTSNTLTLRRKPTVVVPTAYEATDDDGYFVKPNTKQTLVNQNIPIQNGGVVFENYVYEPKKSLDISPTPSVIKSTTNTILPAPAPAFASRKRIRVGLVTTPNILFSSTIPHVQVTQVPEIFLQKVVTPAVRVFKEEESRPSEVEIVDVGKGANFVKSTVKGVSKEAISDHSFDRYGPGGWRSRQETLQGTIDCQRAGLFRHPEQCNKFYACRWDCTKKRFTLHIFNCPVHLTFDSNMGACNWPSQGPACAGNTLLPNE